MKILIAEDDEQLRQALVAKFQICKFNIDVANTGVEAIEAMNNCKYEAIVLDLIMPDKDGFDVLRAKPDTLNAATPTYVVTNLGRDSDCSLAKELGATDCFIKSNISLKKVVEIISQEVTSSS